MYTTRELSENNTRDSSSPIYGIVERLVTETMDTLDPRRLVYEPEKTRIQENKNNGNGLYGIEARTINKHGETHLEVLVSESTEHLDTHKIYASVVGEVVRQAPHLARRRYPDKAVNWNLFEYETIPSGALKRDAIEFEEDHPGKRYSIHGGYTKARIPKKNLEFWYPDSIIVLLLDHGIENGDDLRDRFESETTTMALARDIHKKENYSLGGYFLGRLLDKKEAETIQECLSSTIDTLWAYTETIQEARPKIVRHINVGYNSAVIKAEGNGVINQLDALFTRILRLSALRAGLEASTGTRAKKRIDREFKEYAIDKGPMALVVEKIVPLLEEREGLTQEQT